MLWIKVRIWTDIRSSSGKFYLCFIRLFQISFTVINTMHKYTIIIGIELMKDFVNC